MDSNLLGKGQDFSAKIQSVWPGSALPLHIIASSIAGPMSGGDRIWIECARRWSSQKHFRISVVTTPEGVHRARSYSLDKIGFVVLPSFSPIRSGVYLSYILRAITGCLCTLKSIRPSQKRVIFSSSDFLPDTLPALLAKMLMPTTIWVAAFYMFAPSPFDNKSPYTGARRWKGFVYYFSQMILFGAIRKFADMVLVTNEIDKCRFVGCRLAPHKVFPIWGGVDNKSALLVPDKVDRTYDAVFIGRLHPQKGVLELIEIWKVVCSRKKGAKLAIIGTGELVEELKHKVATCGLDQNVSLFGFRDGVEKIAIFKDSRVVVHPAIYDSGGMASCEAMACGLPGVSFDLPALRYYYPKGMLKARCFDFHDFASKVIDLIDNRTLYERIQKEALEFALEMDWDIRADSALRALQAITLRR